MKERRTSRPITAHERSLLLEFLTSHGVMGEILVYEMKTWLSGSVRGSPRGQRHTLPAHRGHAPGPGLRSITSLHCHPGRWQPHSALRQAEATKGSLWPSYPARKCRHSLPRLLQALFGATQLPALSALTCPLGIQEEPTACTEPWSCSPGARSPVGERPAARGASRG